jgi:Ser/Thr protein kinase RdoA (MazF antagonist)
MKPFASLTRAGQRRRLHALARAALAAYRLDGARLAFCSDTQNAVFRVDAAGERYALRLHAPGARSTAAIRAELAWLTAIRRDLELHVPEPVPAPDGRELIDVELPGDPDPRPAVLFRWVVGRPLEDQVTPARLEQLGELMARLHQHATGFTLPSGADRDRDDWPGMGSWPLADDPAGAFLRPNQHALCAAAARRAGEVIARVEPDRDIGLIHSDIHFANCLDCGDAIGLIDFDDCQFAPFTSDLAITLTYLDDRADYERLRDALLDGYARLRAVPAGAETELDAFMVERGLRLILWVASWPRVAHFPFGPEIIDMALRRCARYLEATV